MIKIYTTEDCVYCHALMEWFDEQGIKYEECHASKDPSIKTVPVTRIDLKNGEIAEVIGFDRPAIKKALKKIAE